MRYNNPESAHHATVEMNGKTLAGKTIRTAKAKGPRNRGPSDQDFGRQTPRREESFGDFY